MLNVSRARKMVSPARILGAAGVLCLSLLAGGARAQQLVLTPSSSFAVIGQTVTITLSLVDGASDGASLFNTDTNIFLDPTYLQFVGTAPFTTAATNPFGGTEGTHNVLTGGSQLRVTYDNVSGANFTINNSGKNTALGTFQVKVTNLLLAGTNITLGSKAISASTGGSEVLDGNSFGNVLQGTQGAHLGLVPAPEPSSLWTLGVGAMLLSGAALRGRRRGTQSA